MSAPDLAAAMRELTKLQAELAFVQDNLAGARMARRAVRERVAKACVTCDDIEETVVSWRPPSPQEVAEIDAVHVRHAPTLKEFEPRERALKEAVRLASIDVEKARKTTPPKRGKNAEKTRTDFPRSTTEPLKGKRNAECSRVLPPLTRGERGKPLPQDGVPKPEQGDFEW